MASGVSVFGLLCHVDSKPELTAQGAGNTNKNSIGCGPLTARPLWRAVCPWSLGTGKAPQITSLSALSSQHVPVSSADGRRRRAKNLNLALGLNELLLSFWPRNSHKCSQMAASNVSTAARSPSGASDCRDTSVSGCHITLVPLGRNTQLPHLLPNGHIQLEHSRPQPLRGLL